MAYTGYRGQKIGICSIKTMWGLAKSQELALTDEELYLIVYRETGKDSIRALSQGQIDNVCRVLQNMKDEIKHKQTGKRTDTNGNVWTTSQRNKIYALTEELGWNDNNNRINGFVKRMFGIERIEWLNDTQCIKLIEILKKMVKNKERKEEEQNGD